MRYLLPMLLLILGGTRPLRDQLGPEPPGPIIVGKKGVVVAGDTLVYTISWGPGARATSYDVTRSVAASNGTWAVVADSQSGAAKSAGSTPLPNTFSYTRPTLSHRMWVAAIPWDSATFTVTVVSRNAIGVSTPVSTSWKVSRKPGPPGPIVVDSSAIVIGTLVLPSARGLALAQSQAVCAFKQFGNGAVAGWTVDRAACDSIYAKYVPAAARVVTAGQQARTDSLAKTCVTWTSSLPTAVSVTPRASCSSAVTVTGLALTRGPSAPSLFRNVRGGDEPIVSVSPKGEVTCLRPGLAVVTAIVEGVPGTATVRCEGRPPVVWAMTVPRFPADAARSGMIALSP